MSALQDRRQLRAAARKGARRLDARRPNWFNDLYTPTLTLSDCQECICGQLYGSFDHDAVATVVGGWVRQMVFGKWDKVAMRYGFDVPDDLTTLTVTQAYDELTRAWKHEVFMRRRAARES